MNESEPRAIVEQIFDEFNEGRTVESLMKVLADDVRLRLTVEPGTPMSGEFHGKEGVERYFAAYEQMLDTTEHVVTDIIADGDKVIALGNEAHIIKRTGATVSDLEWATIITFRDGKIIDILVIENTAYISKVYTDR